MKQKGFTLVEILIAVALLSIAIGVTSDILISLVRSSQKTQIMNELEQFANYASLKIKKELMNAKSINTIQSTSSYVSFVGNDNDNHRYGYDGVPDEAIWRDDCDSSWSCVTPLYITPYDANNRNIKVECGPIEGMPNTCFKVTGTKPQVVTISLIFTPIADAYSGSSIEILETVVVRGTY